MLFNIMENENNRLINTEEAKNMLQKYLNKNEFQFN